MHPIRAMPLAIAALVLLASASAAADPCTRFTHANGVSLAYRDLGEPGAPPVLLLMGLGGQLIDWPESFVEGLVEAGFRAILVDNRDAGLSQKLYEEGDPSLVWAFLRQRLGLSAGAPYRLSDMAGDAAALLADRGVDSAHVLGVSMGGMIGQVLALEHPERVRSLVSIMSTSGAPDLPEADPEVLEILRGDRPRDREAALERSVRVQTALAGPAHPPDPEAIRAHAARSYDRSHHPPGTKRQILAILDAAPRAERLRSLEAPTLVIHGTADPLLPPEHGRDTAERIPEAELMLVEGMGHDVPEALVPEILRAVVRHLRRVEGATEASVARDPRGDEAHGSAL